MVKNPRDYGTYDEWWQWIVERHLAAPTWESNPTRGEIHDLFRSYILRQRETRGSLAEFLSAKVDALAPELRVRLTPHLIRHVDMMTKQNEPDVRALLDKLGVEPGIEYTWKRVGRFTAAKMETVGEVQRKQFLAMAGQHCNRKFRAPAAFFRDFGTDPEPDVTYWRISAKTESKKPLYEMWSILKGGGSIFRAGELEPIAYLIGRECWRGDLKLVADLQPSMPWPAEW